MRAQIVLTAVVSLGLTAAVRGADVFGPTSVLPQARSFHVGALELTALHDAQFVVRNDGKTFGLDVDPRAVGDLLRTATAPTDRVTLSVNALLVHTGRHIVLIDTGLGPQLHGGLLASLGLAGISPRAVTDVLITHPHGDHIGGLLDASGHLAFPKATIRMADPAWTWLKAHGPPAMIQAISVHVRTFEPGKQVAPGITSVALPGHTPGHVGYEIVSGDSRLLDIGDVAHSSIVSLAKPQWAVQFDTDRITARATREKTLAELAGNHERVFAPHFPFPGVGYVVASGDAFAWKGEVP